MRILTRVLKGLTLLGVIALAGLLVVSHLLDKEIEDLNSRVQKEITTAEIVKEPAQPVGVLLLGVDSRGEDFEDSRSDAILVASVNPETKTTEIINIPRDTLVEMKEDGGELDKVNHSYMYGGSEMVLETVSNYLDFPIHYVVEINMKGLEDLVDAIDGITIDPALTFTYEGHSFTKGETIVANGEEALTYARMRKTDPKGDVGRGERQQEVIKAIADKVIGLDLISNYSDILGVVKGNLRTNATISTGLVNDYIPALGTINTTAVESYQDLRIGGVYYLGLHEDERVRLSNTLRTNLGLTGTQTNKQYIIDNANIGVRRGYTVPTYELNGTEESLDAESSGDNYLDNVWEDDLEESMQPIEDGGYGSKDESTGNGTESESQTYIIEESLNSSYGLDVEYDLNGGEVYD